MVALADKQEVVTQQEALASRFPHATILGNFTRSPWISQAQPKPALLRHDCIVAANVSIAYAEVRA